MPIANIASVLTKGVLSNERAEKLKHKSVALQAVQDKRHTKQVPGGLRVHQYANLYFHARNPMMYKRRDQAEELCVLRISLKVLKDIYARDWRHPDDQIRQWRHTARKCAEVLVPHVVEAHYLIGTYVVDEDARELLLEQEFKLPITVDSDLFFR
jgi:hypothetical protein